MRRTVAPIYALILLETLVWIAMVPLAPTFADELGLSGVETGFILAAASLAALVVAFPLGLLADRLGARRVTIASACLFTLATFGQGLADEFWSLLLARLVFGVAFGALWGAGASWLSDSLTEDRRAGALGRRRRSPASASRRARCSPASSPTATRRERRSSSRGRRGRAVTAFARRRGAARAAEPAAAAAARAAPRRRGGTSSCSPASRSSS